MNYEIIVNYDTGDSDGSHEEEYALVPVFASRDEAEAALKALEAHHSLYILHNQFRGDATAKQLKESLVKAKLESWFEPEYWEWSFWAIAGGERTKIGVSWHGYFERLNWAEVRENPLRYTP